LKCLEKEPSKRYGSAEALAEDLERWLQGEPISARRVTVGQRLARWAWRHPRLVTALVLTVVLALVGAWAWDRQRALAEGLAREADDRAASLQAQGRYPEALEAARRATALLPRFGDAALRRQVE